MALNTTTFLFFFPSSSPRSPVPPFPHSPIHSFLSSFWLHIPLAFTSIFLLISFRLSLLSPFIPLTSRSSFLSRAHAVRWPNQDRADHAIVDSNSGASSDAPKTTRTEPTM